MAQKTRRSSARGPESAPLRCEQAVFARNLPGWLAEHRNAHVLIKGKEVVGFYATRDEALAAGYARFGVVPLLVKEILDSEPVYTIPNALL